jgi:hypothetical protein
MVQAPPPPPPAVAILARLRDGAPWLAVLAASILFRLPPLINAPGTNSDAAIVGLQSMHILRGEWSWFLLGSGYQTSVDALVAAGFFALTGPSPFWLMASTLAGHIVLTGLAFSILRRKLSPWLAALLVLPLVFAPDPVHTYVLYPPRQASLTLVFLSFWLLDRAASARRPLLAFGMGAAVASLACFADPYALLFLPVLGLHLLLSAMDGVPPRPLPLRRAGAGLAGLVVGLVPYWLLTHSQGASRGQTSLSAAVIPHNLDLLRNDCLPWLLSTKVYAAKHMSDYMPWETGAPYHLFQLAAASLLVAGLVSGGLLFFRRSLSWEIRRIGVIGFVMVPVTLGGFLVSPMVMDHFSSRYLAAILLCAPFALAPAAKLLKWEQLTVALAPYLVSAAVSGWVSYAPFGLSVHPSLADDQRLGERLRERGIRYAEADYWASYRLTFLYRENPVIVPTNEGEDRYRPYRQAFEKAKVVAYVHDAYRSRESLAELEHRVKSNATPFEPVYDRFEQGNFTVLILARKDEDSRAARAGE